MTISATAIIPSGLVFNVPAVQRAVEACLDDLATQVKTDFEATVATWDDPAPFAVIAKPGLREIFTGQAVYAMLNKGTRQHTITPRGRALVFQVPYQAKTAPRVIGSRSAGVGGQTVYSREVQHPGTAPREWDQAVAEKYRQIIGPVMQRYLNGALRP